MARILKGKDVAEAMAPALRSEAAALAEKGVRPVLGIIRLGERPDDLAYERGAVRRCEGLGVGVNRYALPLDAAESALLALLDEVNHDRSVHGVLLCRPLPAHIDGERVRGFLSVEKDIDGITDASLSGVFTNTRRGFPPCTAEACMEMLAHYGIDPSGKRAVVIGRSLVIGRPVAMMLLHKNATVTICHTRTRGLPSVVREADIVVAAAGEAECLGGECFRPGQTVLDVGIHVRDGILCGDVKAAEAEGVVAALTPVPGGVGAVTTSVSARHVLEAAKRSVDEALLPKA